MTDTATDTVTAVVLDPVAVQNLIHGLAWMRTIFGMSKVEEHYDNPFYVWFLQKQQPSSLGYGENYSNATFKRWVKEDEKRLCEMLHRTIETRGTEAGWKWLQDARIYRMKLLGHMQDTIDALNYTNRQMASALRGCMRTMAIVQCGAEIALTVYGLGGVAIQGARIEFALWNGSMTVRLAVEKAVAGIAGGFAINVVERWDWGQTADLWLLPVNTPGFISDGVNDFYKMRREAALATAEKNFKDIKITSGQAFAAKNAARATVRNLKAPVAPSALGKLMTPLAWVLAIKSGVDSVVKLHDRWDQ